VSPYIDQLTRRERKCNLLVKYVVCWLLFLRNLRRGGPENQSDVVTNVDITAYLIDSLESQFLCVIWFLWSCIRVSCNTVCWCVSILDWEKRSRWRDSQEFATLRRVEPSKLWILNVFVDYNDEMDLNLPCSNPPPYVLINLCVFSSSHEVVEKG